MKHLIRRAAALLLAITTALSLTTPALAADTAAHTVSTLLGEGLTLTQHNSRTGSTRRQMFTLDYLPGGAVRPLVLYGDEIYGKSDISTVISYAEKRGWQVLAAVNSDFFFTGSGVPTGMTIQNGRLVTSDGMWNAVGFFADGTAIADTPRLSITLDNLTTGASAPIYALNNVRTDKGLYLYTRDFDKTTRTSAAGTEAVLALSDPEAFLQLGQAVEATVLSVAAAKSTALKEGQFVLSLTDGNTAGLVLSDLLAVGDTVTITPTTPDERWHDVLWSSGGGNMLVRGGTITPDAAEAGRAPRTLLGVREDGSFTVIQCDGRQSSLSAGLTLTEGAQLLLDQGCTQVINLDGGGSSILAAAYPGMEPQVLSSPSDGAPRACATYLLFVTTGEGADEPFGSVVYPRSATLLTGASLEVSAVEYDRAMRAVTPIEPSFLLADAPLENGILTAPDTPGTITVTLPYQGAQPAVYTVTDKVDSLRFIREGDAISALTLDRGRTAQLDVLAHDGIRAMVTQNTQFTFTVTGNVGTIDENGLFTAGPALAEGSVTASWGGTSVTIPVTITGKTASLLEGFDEGIRCGTFGSALSSAAILTDLTRVRYGTAALGLTYSGLSGETAEYLLTEPVTFEGASHLTVAAKGAGTWSFLFRTRDGHVTTVPFTLEGTGWQTVTGAIPETAVSLLGFACSGAGDFTVALDGLTAHFGGVVEDVTPPAISMTITDTTLHATLSDSGEMPLTAEDITVTIDGAPAGFTFADDRLTCVLPTDGLLHRVTVTAQDAMGNLARQSADMGTLESTFADLQGHWAASYAQYLYQKGVFSPAVNFDPNTPVSTEMAATMLSRYLGVDTDRYADVELPFLDADSIGSWALPHVKAMYAMGILQGSADHLGRPVLQPKAGCTRAQIMTILGRTVARGYAYEPCTFADADTIPSWARDHMDLLASLGILTGNDLGRAEPLGTITRAQFAALLYRMD